MICQELSKLLICSSTMQILPVTDMLWHKMDGQGLRHIPATQRHLLLLVLGRYWFFRSVPVSVLKPRFLLFHGTGSGTSVLALIARYQDFGTRFSEIICIFLILVLVHFQFGTILIPNQVEPKAWYWNLNWLGPKLLKIFGIKIQKLQIHLAVFR